MRKIRRIKRFWGVLCNAAERLKYEWNYQKMIQGWENYIPKYFKRSWAEHEQNRWLTKQIPETCDHLKGGHYARNAFKDYNVSLHKFIDGTSRIRCLSCGQKWFEKDFEWVEALRMVQLSTNSATSNEIPLLTIHRDIGNTDGERTIEQMRRDFPKWNGQIGTYKETE